MNLQLSLTRHWFEMTANGEKTEDYREVTPYWIKRFCTEKLDNFEFCDLCEHKCQENGHRKFDTTTLTLGYPKRTDTSRIIRFECKGIEIGHGKPEWGAEPGKVYFIIKHGKRLDQ